VRAEDWGSFDFTYRLDLRSLVPHIIAIEEYKAAACNPVLPPHWLETPAAAAGSQPGIVRDNPTLRTEPTAAPNSATERAGNSHSETSEQQPVRDAAKARAWIRQRFAPGSGPVLLTDILTLHGMVAEEHRVTGPTAGALRTAAVEVGRELVGGVHQGAPAKQLPVLMERYVDFISGPDLRSLPPPIRALLAHFFLDTIHPFADGNGRTSRLVAAAILCQHGYNLHGTYGLIRYFYRHELRYHTMLQQIWKRCPFEVTPFIAFGIEGFIFELKSVDAFVRMKLNRMRDTELFVPVFRRRIGARPCGANRPR
jgi:Fic family protein